MIPVLTHHHHNHVQVLRRNWDLISHSIIVRRNNTIHRFINSKSISFIHLITVLPTLRSLVLSSFNFNDDDDDDNTRYHGWGFTLQSEMDHLQLIHFILLNLFVWCSTILEKDGIILLNFIYTSKSVSILDPLRSFLVFRSLVLSCLYFKGGIISTKCYANPVEKRELLQPRYVSRCPYSLKCNHLIHHLILSISWWIKN